MENTIAWELAKKRFEEIEGYTPNLNNKTHELMVSCLHEGILTGANWQAERMYSEEDMIEFAKWIFLEVGSNTGKDRTNKELFNEWFEQFKKK